jgi:hypothetical protein
MDLGVFRRPSRRIENPPMLLERQKRRWIRPEGPGKHSPGFIRISAKLIKALTGRMYFVPEGRHDRSQARSAWDSANP